MKGGAVRLERSPLKEAMDYGHRGATEVSTECFADQGRVPTAIWAGQGRGEGEGNVAPTYLEEGGPAAALGRLRI